MRLIIRTCFINCKLQRPYLVLENSEINLHCLQDGPFLNFPVVFSKICQAWGVTRSFDELNLECRVGNQQPLLVSSKDEWVTFWKIVLIQERRVSSNLTEVYLQVVERPPVPAQFTVAANGFSNAERRAEVESSRFASSREFPISHCSHYPFPSLNDLVATSASSPAASTAIHAEPGTQSVLNSTSHATFTPATRETSQRFEAYRTARDTEDPNFPASQCDAQSTLDRATRNAIAFGADLGRDISSVFYTHLSEVLGRSGPLPTTGTEAAHAIVSAVEGLLGGDSSRPDNDVPTAQLVSEADATASASETQQTMASDGQGGRTDSQTQSHDPQVDLSDFDRLMARSRAQGEALNAFFGNITQRRAARLRGARQASAAGKIDENTTGTLSEPLRTSSAQLAPLSATRSSELSPLRAQGCAIASQNAQLKDLWQRRLAESGHLLPENQAYISQFPSSSVNPDYDRRGQQSDPDTSGWGLLRNSSLSGTARSFSTKTESDNSSESKELESKKVSSIEEQNQSLAEAFSEMLARSRREAV